MDIFKLFFSGPFFSDPFCKFSAVFTHSSWYISYTLYKYFRAHFIHFYNVFYTFSWCIFSHAHIISDIFFWVHYILYIFLCILYTFSGLSYTIFWYIVYIFPDALYPSFMVHLYHTFYQYFGHLLFIFPCAFYTFFSESVYIFFWCILYIYILCYIHISHCLLSLVLVQFIHFLNAFNTFFLVQLTNILEHTFIQCSIHRMHFFWRIL